MAERASLFPANNSGVAGPVTALDARYGLAAGYQGTGLITARSGFRPSAAAPGLVTATTPTANKFIHVAAFQHVQQSLRGGGVYVQTNDATIDINVIDGYPPDASNSRRDLVIIHQSDIGFADADSQMRVRYVTGTPGSGSDPSLAAYPEYRTLARVIVPPGATVINPGDITDLRNTAGGGIFTVASGGILPIASTGERAAITAPYEGMAIYRTDKDWIELYDGSAWRVRGMVTVAALADITDPVTDQVVYLSTYARIYRWTGTVWFPVNGTIGGRIVSAAGAIHTGIAGTEVDVAKLALENSRVVSGRTYELNVNLYVNFTAADNAFLVRVRKDTALSGSVIAAWQWDSPIIGDDTRSMSQPWVATASDTDADFYVSVQRITGGGTMGIYGDRRAAFWIDDKGGDPAIWVEVP